MKIKYVGLKQDGESAFEALTGLVWLPDSSHEIKDDVAAKMLQHPDVFAVDEGLNAPETVTTEFIMQLADGTTQVLNGMSLDELRELSKEMGLTPHAKAKELSLMTKLVEAFPVKAAA